MQTRRANPRAEYRLVQSQRIDAAPTLLKKFPALKSLTVNLEYFDDTGLTRNGGMKYKANLEKAKSLLYFICHNGECIGGDYDLTKELSRAIAGGQKQVSGEMRCNGTRANKKEKRPAATSCAINCG